MANLFLPSKQIEIAFITQFNIFMSSFKDRLSFWEQKNKVQEVKPFPKAPLFQPKKLNIVSTPVQSNKHPQAPPKVFVTQKSLIEEPKKPNIEIKNQPQKHKLPEPIIKSPVKQQVSQKIKTQQNQSQSQNKVSSVKDKINKFNNLAIPVFGSVSQSCYFGSFKNKEAPKIQNQGQKKTESQTNLIKSTPLYGVVTQDEHKLSFKQRILMAEKTFANRNIYNLPRKQVIQAPKQEDQQGSQAQTTPDKQKLTSHETETETTKESQETKADNESNRLFLDSIKDESQKPNLLVNGQANELTLQTRMTKRPKRKNNDDDFDDL